MVIEIIFLLVFKSLKMLQSVCKIFQTQKKDFFHCSRTVKDEKNWSETDDPNRDVLCWYF